MKSATPKQSTTLPDKRKKYELIYNLIKKAEPLDCWEAYDEAINPILDLIDQAVAKELTTIKFSHNPETYLDYRLKQLNSNKGASDGDL